MPEIETEVAATEHPVKRVSKLTPEERKARASSAAKAMWEKKRNAKALAKQEPGVTPVDATQVPAPATEQQAAVKVEPPPMPKEFARALTAAEKDFEKTLADLKQHERSLAHHSAMVQMLRAKIPMLAQAIRALGGSVSSAAETPGGMALRGPEINYPPPEAPLPSIPAARGGSMGVINDARTAEDENMFLRDSESVGAGGGWQ